MGASENADDERSILKTSRGLLFHAEEEILLHNCELIYALLIDCTLFGNMLILRLAIINIKRGKS